MGIDWAWNIIHWQFLFLRKVDIVSSASNVNFRGTYFRPGGARLGPPPPLWLTHPAPPPAHNSSKISYQSWLTWMDEYIILCFICSLYLDRYMCVCIDITGWVSGFSRWVTDMWRRSIGTSCLLSQNGFTKLLIYLFIFNTILKWSEFPL